MKLQFEIKSLTSNEIDLTSWVSGNRESTEYHHGTFDNVSEIVESIAMRREDICRQLEREHPSWV